MTDEKVRQCPKCKVLVEYSSKHECKRANRNKTICSKCRYQNLKIRNKKRAKITTEQKIKIISLMKTGLPYNDIKKELRLSITDAYFTKLAKANNLQRNRPQKLNLIDDNQAQCSKCSLIKPIDQFKRNRHCKEKSFVGYFSFCKTCLYRQECLAINKNILRRFNEICKNIQRRCLKKNIPFDLTGEFLLDCYNKQNGLCFYTDEKMVLVKGNGIRRLSLSVDQVLPGKGYVKTNVVLCAHIINRVKTDLTLEEIGKWMPGWYRRIKQNGLC